MANQRLALLALTAGAVMLAAACDEARIIEAQEGASVETCATCHGFPPLQTRSGAPHPQSQACFACHAQTVDRANQLIPGGPHANGVIDSNFGHAEPSYVGRHSGDAIADIQLCSVCHGQDYGGGVAVVGGEERVSPSCNACHAGFGFANWQSNCTFCHGTRNTAFTFESLAEAAPPQGVREGTVPTDPQVGAHQKHLGNGSVLSNGFPCWICHALNGGLDHLDGLAPITFQLHPLASSGGATPSFTKATQTCSSVYCHGSTLQGGAATEPQWTVALTACSSCHGIPPPTGQHGVHTAKVACAECHAGYTDTTVNKDTHVDGTRTVNRVVIGPAPTFTHTVLPAEPVQGWDCAACHI
jgi:predicted CxxxxCH...CXXCH cytochrome family protein